MKNYITLALKLVTIVALLLYLSGCVYDGKVRDPSDGLEADAGTILFNHAQWVEAQQAEYDENSRSIDGLIALNKSIEERVAARAEEVETAVGEAAAELEARNKIGRTLVSLGSDYAVEAVPGAGPLLEAVLPYLFGGAVGAAAAAGGPAAVRKLKKNKTDTSKT